MAFTISIQMLCNTLPARNPPRQDGNLLMMKPTPKQLTTMLDCLTSTQCMDATSESTTSVWKRRRNHGLAVLVVTPQIQALHQYLKRHSTNYPQMCSPPSSRPETVRPAGGTNGRQSTSMVFEHIFLHQLSGSLSENFDGYIILLQTQRWSLARAWH